MHLSTLKLKSILLLGAAIYFTEARAQTNFTTAWSSTSPSTVLPGVLANYVLIASNPNSTGTGCSGSCLPAGSAVTVTFPAGTNATTFNGGYYYGSQITGATASGNTITFLSPVEIPKNTSFKITLNNITNPPAGQYTTLEMTVRNASQGVSRFNMSAYAIVNGVNMANGVTTSCNGLLFDSGGPTKDYANNESLTYTISPAGTTSVTLEFSKFNTQTTDQLFIYNGPTTNSPQVTGSPFSGTAIPPSITTTQGSVTLRFTSDAATTAAGWQASWVCNGAGAPIADFWADPVATCEGQSVNFTDLSSNSPTSWSWSFPGGRPSSSIQKNPAGVVYPVEGVYPVTLTTTNATGSGSITRNGYITVAAGPCPVTIGTATTVNTITSYPAPYGNFYDGARHQLLFLASELKNANGGAGHIKSLSFTVAAAQGSPLEDFTIKLAPAKADVLAKNFIDTSFTTVFGPELYTETAGLNTHTFDRPFYWNGTDNLLVEICFNNSGNSFNATTQYSVTPFKSVTFYRENDFGVCDSMIGTNTSQNRPNVRMGISLCTSSPGAEFSSSTTALCRDDSISFSDLSTCNPTSWLWLFPGGTPSSSTLQNPMIHYSKAGVYDATLIATNEYGSDTIVKKGAITVDVPNAEFSASSNSIIAGEYIDFKDLSSCSATSWLWSFPGAIPSSSAYQNPRGITYPCGGVYPVTLTATNDSGSYTCVKTEYIHVEGPAFCNTYENTKRGLDFVQSTILINRRGGTMGDCNHIPGPEPKTLSVAGIPAGAVIEAAYMWWTLSGRIKSTSVTITNPGGAVATIPAILIGTGPDKCWLLGGTQSFRADVKSIITGNGNYVITGLPQSLPQMGSDDTDGLTLVIIYSRATAAFTGSLTIMDGLHVGRSENANTVQIMKTTAACDAPANARSFMLVGDFQNDATNNADSVNLVKLPNSNYRNFLPYCLWGYYGDAVTLSPKQDTFSFGIKEQRQNGTDCYGLAAMGNYYQCPADFCVVPNKPSSIRGSDTICAGQRGIVYTIPAISNALSYEWAVPPGASIALGQGSNSITVDFGDSTGSICVKAVNACGTGEPTCMNVLFSPFAVTANAGEDTSVTCSETVNLVGSADGGDGRYSFQWIGGPDSSIYANAGAGTYILKVTDGKGCVSYDTVYVTNANSDISAAINASANELCRGDSVIIFAEVLGAQGPVLYEWSEAAFATTAGPHVISPKEDFQLNLKVTDSLGCSVETSLVIKVNALPIITSSPDVDICLGDSTTLTASGADNFLWSPAEGLSTVSGYSVIAKPDTTTTYTIIGTNAKGCKDTASVTVKVFPLPVVTASANVAICPGDSVTLTASGALVYFWSPSDGLNNTTGPTVVAKPDSTTTYIVTGTDERGCTDTAMVTVKVLPLPVVTVSPDVSICRGDSAILIADGAITYLWSPAKGLNTNTGATVIAKPDSTTIYIVTGTDEKGCSDTASVKVIIKPLPVASFSYTKNGLEVKFTADSLTEVTQWTWDFGDRSAQETGRIVQHTYIQASVYTITLIAANSCGSDTIQVEITVDGSTNSVNVQSSFDPHIRIFPNPFDQTTTIDFILQKNDPDFSMKICDLLGREVAPYSLNEHLSAGRHSYSISVQKLNGVGVHYVSLRIEGVEYVYKLVVM